MKGSICFTGNNVAEVGAFISPTLFEFTGETFVLPAPDVTYILRKGDTLIKHDDDSFSVETPPIIWPTTAESETVAVGTKKKRGKKK